MKKQVISILFAIILIFTVKNTCYAASASISCDTSAIVGKEITITANVTGVMWNLELKVNGETIAKNSELENYESNKTVSFSGKYTPQTEETLNVTLIGSVTEFSDGSTIREFAPKSITVKASVVTTPKEQETPTTPTTPPATTVTKSSEARLKSLGINPNNFSGFKKDKTEYSVTVPNDVKEVEIYGEKVHDKAKVEGLGKVSLKEGDNTFKVKVTAEDGTTTKTYKITIKRKTVTEEENENGEARLKDLGIKPKEYDFSGFDSEKTEYSAEVPNEVQEIEVFATAMDSNAQITGTGMIELKEGENELKIEVIAVNGTKKTYTLTVTRKEAEKKEVLGLSILSIEGLKLSPEFKSEIYEYTATLEKDVDSLQINANANNEDATVEIVGNENLQQGENVITILVTNQKTEEVTTYQIIVNKNVTIVETVQTSWLKPSTWGKEEKIKIAIILVLIILIVWAIILKIKISKGNPKNKKVDFPGADELDKAIAEHQELVEEPNYITTEPEKEEITMNDEQITSQHEVEQQNYIEEIAKKRFGSIEERSTEKPKRRGRHF